MKLNTDAESATEEVLPSHVIVGVENCDFPSHLLFPFVFQLHCGRSISVWAQGSEGGFRCHEGIEKGSTEGCQETVMGSVVSHLGISTFGQACQSGELREEGSNNGKWTEGKSRDLRSSVCSCQNP